LASCCAVVYDRDDKQYLYVDGVEKDSEDITAFQNQDLTNPGDPLTIGVLGSYNYYWNGTIDEVKIFARALSPAEISNLYAGEKTHKVELYADASLGISNETPEPDTSDSSGLVGYWKFEGSNVSYDYSDQDNAMIQFAGDAQTANDNTNETHIRETTSAQLSYTNDYYNGWTFEATSGAGDGETRTVLDYIYTDSSNKTIILTSSISGFASGDTYKLYSDDSIGPDYTEARFGNGYYFDGVDDHLTTTTRDPRNDEFFVNESTISMWVKPTSLGTSQQLWIKNGPFHGYIHSSGVIYVRVRNDTTLRNAISNITVNENEWNHIVGRYNGTWITIYINNELVNRTQHTGDVLGEGFWDFGRSNNGYLHGNPTSYFQGYMDEIRIYNRSLTESEIEDLYLTRGLVGHWTFDNRDGSNSLIAPDVSKYNNSGTVTGATFTNEGRFKEGYEFDGNGDRISVTENSELNIASNVSWGAWVRALPRGVSGGDANGIVSRKTVAGGREGYNLFLSDQVSNITRCSVDNGSTSVVASADSQITFGNWYHLFCVYNGTHLVKYVNGVLQSGIQSVAFNSMPYPDPDPLIIGRYYTDTNAYYFNGTIDEVKIFNRALTATEVLNLYQGSKTHEFEWWSVVG
jgi:hypothetical protein